MPKYTTPTESNLLFCTVSHRRDLRNVLDTHSIEIIKSQKETAKKLYALERGQKGSKEYRATFERYEILIKELNRENLFEFIFIIPKEKKEKISVKYVPRKAKQKFTHKQIEIKPRKEISLSELLAENDRLIRRLAAFEPSELKEALKDFERYKDIQAILSTKRISYNKFKLYPETYSRVLMLLGEKCHDCGTLQYLTIHHVKPKSEGGRNDIGNLEILCKFCHDREHMILKRNGFLMKIINEAGMKVTA